MAYRTGGADSGQRLSLLVSPRSPSLRFSSPLIEPGVRISRTRLSDGFSRQGVRLADQTSCGQDSGRQHAQLPKYLIGGEPPVTRPGHFVPTPKEATDGVIEIQFHPVSRLRHRPIAEVGRPSPHRAVQAPRHVFPWRGDYRTAGVAGYVP